MLRDLWERRRVHEEDRSRVVDPTVAVSAEGEAAGPGEQAAGTGEVEQNDGVTRIEALYIVFGKGWKLVTLWTAIGLISFVFSMSSNTIYWYTPFATSAFGEHTIVATVSVITGIVDGVAKPFIAKIADVWTRPAALATAVILYAIGCAMIAGANNINTVVGGQVIFTLGNTGIQLLNTILLGDLTSMQWRGLILGIVSLPNIIWGFVSGDIAAGVNAYGPGDGWRWGYGMFAILVPVSLVPALWILFWGDFKAKKVGALSLASSTYARQRILAGEEKEQRTWWQAGLHHASRINALGLLIMGFAFACLLSPFTLVYGAENGYKNPSMIALLVVGGVLLIVWALYDGFIAKYPIMPRRVINRTLVCAVLIDFNYFLSGYLSDTYWASWLWVTFGDLTDQEYNYVLNILTVGLTVFAIMAGAAMRYFHRYKHVQMFGLAVRVIGMGLNFYSVNGNHALVVQIMSRILISIGGGCSVITSQVASQISVPHQDLGIAIAILGLWTAVGRGVGSAISGSVWSDRLPRTLQENLGAYYNATELQGMFNDFRVARLAEPREAVVRAYDDAVYPLFLAAMVLSLLSLFCNFFMTNFYLDDRHNACETKVTRMRDAKETDPEVLAAQVRAREAQILAEAEMMAGAHKERDAA